MPPVTRIAADIGGTFTDLAVLTADGALATRKVPSTPANYADAVIRGIRELLEELDSPAAELREVLHGCTVATNAILEHKGARTALLTTKGFRDVLELSRVRSPRLYDLRFRKPVWSSGASASRSTNGPAGRGRSSGRSMQRPSTGWRSGSSRKGLKRWRSASSTPTSTPPTSLRQSVGWRSICPRFRSPPRPNCCRRSGSSSGPARPWSTPTCGRSSNATGPRFRSGWNGSG